MSNTTEKRKFYNFGEAKGFTKAIFFQTVAAMAAGEDVDSDLIDLVGAAANYELEGIANRTSSKATGERKDPLQSDYANELRDAILPLIDGTPRTAGELVEMATAKGKVSSKNGKAFSAPWVSRVLNAEAGVEKVKKIVDKTDAKGLKSQSEVNAYKRA